MTYANKYDALIVLSFGGPEGMNDVMPYLDNVLRGRNVPDERKREVAHHYEAFGGVSPLNAQNRALIDALRKEFDAHGMALPIYWGNRNWHPFLTDTLKEMTEAGMKRVLAFVTSAYSSYSGCRQYREDIENAREQVGAAAPTVDKLRLFFNHPGFVEVNADRVGEALGQVPGERRAATPVLFTAHSIPRVMAECCAYEEQLLETSRLVAEQVGVLRWQLAYQSRSGPPSQPWLEPDVCDVLRDLSIDGVTDVVVSPIGFTSDHLEVLYDLDTEARELCEEIGLNMVRAGTAGNDPRIIGMIRELVEERLDGESAPRALGALRPWPDVCPEGCCIPKRAHKA